MAESRIASPVKVLIADVGAAFKKTAAEALTGKGFTVALSSQPEETFEKVRSLEPDIVLYDLDLPGYDGLEAVTLMAKMRSGKSSYIVASSIHKGADFRAKALGAEAWEFLVRPVDLDFFVETALAVRRHMRRERPDPSAKPANRSLKASARRCGRADCTGMTVAYSLRGEPMAVEADQFETLLYKRAVPGHEFVDYNLLSVTVCPECYRAVDEAALPAAPAGKAGKEPTVTGNAHEPDLFRIAATADDLLFSEHRSPASAVAAYRLAIANLEGAGGEVVDDIDTAAALADLLFKAATVAHEGRDVRLRDRSFARAEEVCSAMTALEPCAAVYRAAYRLAALYVFFNRDQDAAKVVKTFERYAKPAQGRMKPRDARIRDKYHSATLRMIANATRYRRASYLQDET